MVMKKVIKITAYVLLIAILSLIFIVPKNGSAKIEKDGGYKALLTVWQIDSFDGGKGSRTSFLRSVSTSFSKKYQGVLVLVISHTVESAKKMIEEGKIPDIISVGSTGLDCSLYQKEVGNLDVEGGGVINGKRYFVPWAKSGYFKITKGNGDKVIVSEGKYNSASIALALSKVNFKSYKLLNRVDAFNEFLLTKDATLIGTVRDVIRLESRNVDCEIEVLGNFNDLYQYALITSKENAYYSRLFIDYLLSDKVQGKLVNLSLLSVNKVGLYPENKALSALEKTKTIYTVSPFLDLNTTLRIKEVAKEVLNGSKDKEELTKHL